MAELVRDPVCGMMVEDGQHATEYLKISHSFCSLQCRERFLANPNLYVGAPGHRAPKSAGLEVIKQRRLRLAQALLPGQADVLRPALQAMMGVQSVSVEDDCIVIVYDLLQATTEQIGQRLSEIGIQLGIGWPERLKRAFVHYSVPLCIMKRNAKSAILRLIRRCGAIATNSGWLRAKGGVRCGII